MQKSFRHSAQRTAESHSTNETELHEGRIVWHPASRDGCVAETVLFLLLCMCMCRDAGNVAEVEFDRVIKSLPFFPREIKRTISE